MIIANKEISVTGKLFRTARLRHEWCDFLDNPADAVQQLQQGRALADLFTFVEDVGDDSRNYPFYTEPAAIAVLPVTTFKQWWDEIGFKARNKVRKVQKCGVELREVGLDDDFAKGVAAIYNETPVRQGRKFYHYGQQAAEVREELSSFLEQCIFVGAYHQNELIGFMKLLPRKNVLRTIHIIAKISHRDKCVMDALIGQAVEICDHRNIRRLHYGSWADGGVGDFREKHGFRRMEVPRYFLPLTLRGRILLGLKLHRPVRERLPKKLVEHLIGLRTKLTLIKYRHAKEIAGR